MAIFALDTARPAETARLVFTARLVDTARRVHTARLVDTAVFPSCGRLVDTASRRPGYSRFLGRRGERRRLSWDLR